MCRISVQTAFRKALSWLTTTTVDEHCFKYDWRNCIEGRSKWFVGSSRSSKSGRTNSALARATRISHPPESVLVGLSCILGENPSPLKIFAARASALSISISDIRS
mmetsp:Transcript_18572/g.45574  ORF Transcript_18572/g.45574 Transcript_18572/m.45574 type:complete len:106 (+) Transcript_18572:1439-1756(+)